MKEVKVTYQPIGRLGNQMFQCAAAIGYAKKYKVVWACPNDTKEVPYFHSAFPGLPRHDGHEFRRYNAADPSQFNYAPIPEHPNGVKLVGFFQSEKYFEGAHDEIRKVFKLPSTDLFKEHISIHIRRGDYVQHSNSFPPVTLGYIDEAIKYLHHETGFAKFIVFSDGIEWVKNELKKSVWRDFEFKYCYEENEIQALGTMHSCSHHIIANSTFSWWGAWLNPDPNKIVVSPSADNWFGPGFTGGVPKDLIPASWHQIKFR